MPRYSLTCTGLQIDSSGTLEPPSIVLGRAAQAALTISIDGEQRHIAIVVEIAAKDVRLAVAVPCLHVPSSVGRFPNARHTIRFSRLPTFSVLHTEPPQLSV